MTNKINYNSGKKITNNILGIFLVSLFVLSPFVDVVAFEEVVNDGASDSSSVEVSVQAEDNFSRDIAAPEKNLSTNDTSELTSAPVVAGPSGGRSKAIAKAPLPLSVSFEAQPTEIELNSFSILFWVSEGAVSCASSDFSTFGATSGIISVRPAITDLGDTFTYMISCTDVVGESVESSLVITATRPAAVPVSIPNQGDPVQTAPMNAAASVILVANPAEIQVGGSSTLTWTSQNAVSCVSNDFSVNQLNGSAIVTPNLAVGETIAYLVSCTNVAGDITIAQATVTAIPSQTSGSGSSSGGGSRGNRNSNNNGIVLGATTVNTSALESCSYSRDFMRMDWENNSTEVMKIQSFLKTFENLDVDINGIFDQKTFMAVKAFQEKYRAEILSPWGYGDATGFVYILTKNKINEIYCNKTIPLAVSETQEIEKFRNYVASALSVNPVGGSLEDANISVWGQVAEDVDVEPVATQDDVDLSDKSTANVSDSGGGFWNFIKDLFR